MFGVLDMAMTDFESEVYYAATVVGDGFAVSGREIRDFLELEGREACRAVGRQRIHEAARSLYRKGFMDIYETLGETPLYDALPVRGQRRKREYRQ